MVNVIYDVLMYDRSQRPRIVSLASLVAEHTSGTQPTAYLQTIGALHIVMLDNDDTIKMT